MEKVSFYRTCPCPEHPDLQIQLVYIGNKYEKDLYCSNCIIESEDPQSLVFTLKTFDKFMDSAATLYSKARPLVDALSEEAVEHANFNSRKGESLEKMSIHIENEKRKVEEIFNNITQMVMDLLSQKKKELFDILDKQTINLGNHYEEFEKILKKTYYKPEDFSFLFPNKDELYERMSQARSFQQVSSVVKNLKQEIKEIEEKQTSSYFEYNNKCLSYLKNFLINFEFNKPQCNIDKLDLAGFLTAFQQNLDNSFKKSAILENLVEEVQNFSAFGESTILDDQGFELLRSWLPRKNFIPLYRSSRDGRKFHEKCDKKGPTITLIKCQFQGSSGTNVIGGYLDTSWSSDNKPINSSNAFVFSLTEKSKCDVLKPEYAAFGSSSCGVNFGWGAIVIKEDLSSAYLTMNTESYGNVSKLVNLAGQKAQTVYFKVLDIEVYALK